MNPAVPRLQDGPGGAYPIFRGKPLYHPDRARGGAEKTARGFVPQDKCLLIIPSPLLGYGLDLLLQKLPADSRILCLEAEENLFRLSLESIPPEILGDRRIHFVRTGDPETAAEEAERIFGLDNFRRTASLILNRGAALHSAFYPEVEAALLRRIQTYWRNRHTAAHLARLWVGNLFTNLPLLPQSFPLNKLRIERPVIILGAGESLEFHIPFLQKRRKDLFVVAVDTALAVLLARGLRPDLVVAAEAQFANLSNFSGLRNWTLPVAADILSYPPILRRFSGQRYLFTSRFAELNWFKQPQVRNFLPPLLPALGSVGVMALELVAGASSPDLPIILAGLDLSYLPEKPHARGSYTHRLFLMENSRLSFPRQYAAWCGRPRGQRLFKDGSSGPADLVLASYREGIFRIASSRGAVYDLPGRGLDLGIPELSYGEAEDLIAGYTTGAAGGPLPAPSAVGGRDKWSPEETGAFIGELLMNMEALTDLSPQEAAARLKALDILTADLPPRSEASSCPGEDPLAPFLRSRLALCIRKLRRAEELL